MSQQNVTNQSTNGHKTQQCDEYSCFRIHLFCILKIRQSAFNSVFRDLIKKSVTYYCFYWWQCKNRIRHLKLFLCKTKFRITRKPLQHSLRWSVLNCQLNTWSFNTCSHVQMIHQHFAVVPEGQVAWSYSVSVYILFKLKHTAL